MRARDDVEVVGIRKHHRLYSASHQRRNQLPRESARVTSVKSFSQRRMTAGVISQVGADPLGPAAALRTAGQLAKEAELLSTHLLQ